jgi:hypothetical protein
VNDIKGNINILGTTYTINCKEELEDADGLCDRTVKEIKVCKTLYEAPKKGQLKNLIRHANKVMRHEIIHAFLNESGLVECSNWNDEQIVDFFAYQTPKMHKVFEELDICD